MSNTITPQELAELIMETGHHHHQAYISSEGTDPEWALWYAGYLQTRLWERLGDLPTRSSLVHLLVQANLNFPVDTHPEWPAEYAAFMIERLSSSD